MGLTDFNSNFDSLDVSPCYYYVGIEIIFTKKPVGPDNISRSMEKCKLKIWLYFKLFT